MSNLQLCSDMLDYGKHMMPIPIFKKISDFPKFLDSLI